jgi:taurine transport system permease protein
MSKKRISKSGTNPVKLRLISILSVLLVSGAWVLISISGKVPELFVPRPENVLRAFLEILTEGYRGGTLLEHLGSSLLRVFSGFFLALLTAVPLGLAMGYNDKIGAFFDPIIEFYRPLPPLAYYTILVLWLGIGDESKVALLYMAAFPPLSISSMSAVRGIRREKILAARSLGARQFQIFLHVIFPSCLPEIFTGIRVAVGFTYTTLVAAEIVAATSGIGWVVLDASRFLRSDIIFMGILVMGLTGILLDRLLRYAEKKIVPWKGK